MVNDRLRVTMKSQAITEARLGGLLSVDPKTVQRWVTKGRTPHRTTATRAAELLGVPTAWLWPDLDADPMAATAGEVVAFYAHRAQVPNHVWLDQALRVKERIDIFTYAGLFLAEENADMMEIIQHKAATGTVVRVALGDPDSAEVKLRGYEEGLPAEIPSRVRMSLRYFTPLVGAPGVDFRLHKTTLYNSFYRFDDEMLINQHAYGIFGWQAPILHLRNTSTGDLFTTYETSMNRAWAETYPYSPTPTGR